MTLDGVGSGGVKIKLIGKVRPNTRVAAGVGDGPASVVTMDIHLGGPALFGPIGMVVAAALRGDIKTSLDNFVTVFAS
jgi:hypothetical protein